MKKQLLLLAMILLPLVASAHDIEVKNADGITIYYNFINDSTELEVTFRGSDYVSFRGEYWGNIVIPSEVSYMKRTLKVTNIGNYTFFDCSTTSVTIPNSLKFIGDHAFEANKYLSSITFGNSLTSIGDNAFTDCSSLTSITFGNSLTSIGKYAFYRCSNLSSITFGDSLTSIGDHAFEANISLSSITFGNSLTSIGASAFSGCSSLISIITPNSLTYIGSGAFSGCSSLTSITFGNSLTSIGASAFSGCSCLISITIPNSLTYIGSGAFYGCSNLTSVIIGSGVTSIGSSAFSSTNLKKVIWLTNTPPTGYYYASGIINYVSNENFTVFSNNIVYPFLSSYFDVDGIIYVPLSPSERTCDAIDCVYNSTSNNTVIASTVNYKGISMSVKNIQPYLAYNNIYIENLNVDIDGNVPEYAFTDCSNMSTATLGDKVSAIGDYVFSGCSTLESINIPDAVKTLGSYAFQDCSVLKSAKMGDGIETINEYTFSNCKSLLDVKIGNNVKKINQHAFTGCSELPSIIIPMSTTEIGNHVFFGCTQLNKVIMENSESELNLGLYVFSGCKLDSVYIGRNISYNTSSSHGYSPFYRNTSLRAVKITDKETEISPNEFYGCTNLQRVIIGDGVTTISDYAFSGCQSLKFFTFGAQVKTIGKEAFSDCTAVVEITSKAQTPPTCGTQALDDINKWNCKLFVPKGCVVAYQAADQWKDFFFTEEGEGSGGEGSDEKPTTSKCEKPNISYTNGQLSFASDTEGVGFITEITDSDIKKYYDETIQLTATYTIRVYATKAGYDNSDVATATLCWIDVTPKTEGITDGIASIPANAVLIQSERGTIKVQGCDEGEQVCVYSINGTQAGSSVSQNGAAIVNTNLQPGSIAIVKVGEKSIKVVIH